MNKQQLEKAYLDTTYTVHANRQIFQVYIGMLNTEFDHWLYENDIHSWVMMTAANPYSRELSVEQNELRNNKLREQLIANGYTFYYSEGIPPNEEWTTEPGFFITNIALEQAKNLAKEVAQNAIVFGEQGAAAQLVWI